LCNACRKRHFGNGACSNSRRRSMRGQENRRNLTGRKASTNWSSSGLAKLEASLTWLVNASRTGDISPILLVLKAMPLDIGAIVRECEDHLFPSIGLNIRERSLYYHLLVVSLTSPSWAAVLADSRLSAPSRLVINRLGHWSYRRPNGPSRYCASCVRLRLRTRIEFGAPSTGTSGAGR
jgi:hypothetical protein